MINVDGIPRDTIAIGASAGGVEALIELLRGLPGTLPAAILLVLHRSPLYETQLTLVLGRQTALTVLEPEDDTPIVPGRVYVAPRDRHMTLQRGRLQLSRGPKEHRFRPAIDPLFRSVAADRGRHAVGVVLSGMGSDGVLGLNEIKSRGGLSLVQRPSDAIFGTLPAHAISKDHVDASLDLRELADALVALASGEPVETAPPPTVNH
jgi:two-component system, chemotaxis family, protein-glutamate methylesterase/glutaminase